MFKVPIFSRKKKKAIKEKRKNILLLAKLELNRWRIYKQDTVLRKEIALEEATDLYVKADIRAEILILQQDIDKLLEQMNTIDEWYHDEFGFY